jgi:hypothetical protein
MDSLAKIAEQRIREAIERGEFDNLPLHGKPVKLDDLSGVPEHLRMGYKILKNANVLPEEMQLKKDIVTLKNLLDACYDEAEKSALQQKMNEKTLRYNMLMEKQAGRRRGGAGGDASLRSYRQRVLTKLRAGSP